MDRNAGLPAYLLDRCSVLSLFEYERDLLLAEPRLFIGGFPRPAPAKPNRDFSKNMDHSEGLSSHAKRQQDERRHGAV